MQDENHALPNTRYGYDSASRLAEVRQTLGGGEVVTRYGYGCDGNLTSVTDLNGNVTTYLYDDFGQMLRQTSPVTGETTYEYDDGGNLVRSVDARGAVTTRSYDVRRRRGKRGHSFEFHFKCLDRKQKGSQLRISLQMPGSHVASSWI